ncbi:hypothetical protein [Tritonibacter mobilis]|nr:hypothetical protein [Tritonibacter mobilis]
MSLEAWGDENPDDAHYDSWSDAASEAGWIDPDDLSQASLDIIQERDRQQNEEGWTPEHDHSHASGELSRAAACYAFASFHDTHYRDDGTPVGWPWDAAWWKPKDARANLVRAAALITAEIDRLDLIARVEQLASHKGDDDQCLKWPEISIKFMPAQKGPMPHVKTPSAHIQSEIWQHVRSGGLYTIIGHGLIEADLTPATIYRSLWDGAVWVRPTAEFEDGRFRNLSVDEVTDCRPEADKAR